MKFILFPISILPVFFLALFIYKKDSVKEPKSLLFGLFASGFLSVIITIVVSLIIMIFFPNLYLSSNYNNLNFFVLFIMIFFQIALVEEFSKWIMIRSLGYNHKDFDQLYDIIVYSVFVSLGFALVENVFYVMDGGLATGIYRAVFSVPGHASFGVFMGYFLGLAKLADLAFDKFLYRKNMILSVVVPSILHTVFNFCLMTSSLPYLFVFFGFVIILFVNTILRVDKVSSNNFSLK